MNTLNPSINHQITKLNVESISSERRQVLDSLVFYMQDKLANKLSINLIFICTHNSRRSHFAQVWAQTFTTYFKLKNIHSYSGGTEATAIYSTVINTLANQGFETHLIGTGQDEIYSIRLGVNEQPIIGFSKLWNDSFNPQSNFAAVMTCAQADADCPYIAGAEKRIALPFTDPKDYDNSTYETEGYLTKSLEIATDLFYVFNKLTSKI